MLFLLAFLLFVVYSADRLLSDSRPEGRLESYAMASRERLTSLTISSSATDSSSATNVIDARSAVVRCDIGSYELWQHMLQISRQTQYDSNGEYSCQAGILGSSDSHHLLTEIANLLNHKGGSTCSALPPQIEITVHNSSIELKRELARPLAITLSLYDSAITLVVLRNTAESEMAIPYGDRSTLRHAYRIAVTSHKPVSPSKPYMIIIPSQVKTQGATLSLTLFPFQINMSDEIRQVNSITSTEWRLWLGATEWRNHGPQDRYRCSLKRQFGKAIGWRAFKWLLRLCTLCDPPEI